MEDEDGERDDGADGLFDSAYQGVVFRGSTEDGVEGSIFETDTGSQDELMREAKRIGQRLDFPHHGRAAVAARRSKPFEWVNAARPGAAGETDERLAQGRRLGTEPGRWNVGPSRPPRTTTTSSSCSNRFAAIGFPSRRRRRGR
jgi:hypothetical protein